MAATSHELALRYLLELSSDIHLAMLLDPDGGVIAAAPQAPPDRLSKLAAELGREAGTLFGGAGEPVEIDAACDGGAVFLIHTGEGSMVCLTDRSVLPGLIFYDMHAVLMDIDRAAGAEARRVGVGQG
jgi:predicted regulator of Ras-like GTPase activity (Roadblock/LC7/MglB family)